MFVSDPNVGMLRNGGLQMMSWLRCREICFGKQCVSEVVVLVLILTLAG